MGKRKGSKNSGGSNAVQTRKAASNAAQTRKAASGGAGSKRASGAPAAAAAAMSGAQRIAWYALLVLVFYVPLAMSNWSWIGIPVPLTFDQFDIAKVFVMRICVIIGLAAWAWHILFGGGKLRRTKVDYLILGLLAWVALTMLTSIHPPTAFFGKYRRFEGLLSFLTYGGAFFLATQLLDRVSRIRTLAKTLFWSGVVVNGYGVLQSLGADPARWGSLPFEATRAFSTYGNPNLLGGFIVFSLTVSLALALAEERHVWRVVYWIGFIIAVWCWIVAFTRGAWIGGAVAIAIMIGIAIIHRVKVRGIDWGFTGAGGVLGAVLVAASLRADDAVMNVWLRLQSIFEFGEGSAKTRFQIWQAAIEAIKDRPVFGFGADTFRLIFPKYKPVEYVADAGYLSVADNVHNYPLQLAAAIGIPGLLLLLGLFGAVAYFSAPLIFKRVEDPVADRITLGGLWAGCAGYLVHLIFGLSVTGTTVLLWIMMASVLAPLARGVEIRPPAWGPAAAVVIVALAAVLLIGNTVYVVADNHYLKARVIEQGLGRVRAAEQAMRLNPYNDMYRAEVGMAHMDVFIGYITQLETAKQTGTEMAVLAQAETQFRTTERVMLETIEFVPWEYDNYVFLANLYTAAGDYLDPRYHDSSVAIARRGIDEMGFKYGPALRFQLARALLAKGDVDAAYEEARFAAEMDPNYIDVQIMYAGIAEKLGDFQVARDTLEKVVAIQPEHSLAVETLARIEASLAAGQE